MRMVQMGNIWGSRRIIFADISFLGGWKLDLGLNKEGEIVVLMCWLCRIQ